ncbi:MAG: hypothetical protein A2Z16_11040 [Chloroflexi bacterium RBG_16_54_18]|nr:MAG: hypothetical protein A2Z16_11040 [Chloroflexi bacterium RBG_16_54_18]
MDTENKEAKGKSHRIWGWISAVVGGLFTWVSGFLFIVFTSQAPTDISSFLFIALCLAIGVLLLVLGIRGITRKEKRKSKIISICGAIVVLVLAVLFCVAVGNYEPKGNHPQNTVESATNTPHPTSTVPTKISLPTVNLLPTKIPGVLECADIDRAHEELTDLVWEAYKNSIEGEKIYFSGKVEQVYDDAGVVLAFDNLCGTTLDNIPYDIAIKLSKGQHLEGYGTIENLAYLIDHVELEITINPELLIVR